MKAVVSGLVLASCVVGWLAVSEARAEPLPPRDGPPSLSGRVEPVPASPVRASAPVPATPAPSAVANEVPPFDAPPKEELVATYDARAFGPVDEVSRKLVADMNSACSELLISREGPSPRAQRRCNVAADRVAARGRKAVPAIFEALNASGGPLMTMDGRLLEVLGRLDAPDVRDVLADGYERIAGHRIEDRQHELWALDSTLRAMSGAGPDVEPPWVAAPVTDEWTRWNQKAVAWRAFREKIGAKRRAQVRADVLREARASRASDDEAQAFRSISVLLELAPREAKVAAATYIKRELAPEVREAFETLHTEASWRSGVRERGRGTRS